ncbi:hotdog fold thioesterase [Microbacterium sp.]|uniref:PaaI family thioesterase n=1 Tax=Microbacterium sp. TaxID=51671 RepID=UPI0025F087CD|nr:hotdog fold thioesterase [Microbacterium sp.]
MSAVDAQAKAGPQEPWRIALGALDEKLGITVVEQSVAAVVATMPVTGNTQSLGRLHGGGSAALAEAVGSWAALVYASTHGKVCVGVDLNITHHRGARAGTIRATATPLHLGARSTSHQIVIEHEDGAHLATARITNFLLDPH